MLGCITLIGFIPSFRITDELWNITSALYLYSTPDPAEVTRTTGTSPSSGRWLPLMILMVELSEIIEFLIDKTGCENVSKDSDVTEDLGVDGDDFDDLVTSFAKKFNVDISSCLWYFHCGEEGSWNSIGGAFFKSPDKRVKHIPVTPLMLFEFAQKGKWDLPYPEHKLPKRRYDILINQLLIIVFVVVLAYKCASN